MKNTIIFDLDGTLLDTLQDLADAANESVAYCGFPKRSLSEIRQFVGNGVANLIKRALFEKDGVIENYDEAIFNKAHAFFKDYYKIHCMDNTGAYEGIKEMLQALKAKGFKMAIVSNKLDSAVKDLNQKFFGDFIDVAIGDQEGMARKPEPDMVYAAMNQLGASKEETIYVGDSEVDVKTAANAGLDSISVLWGFRSKEILLEAGAKVLAEKAEDIFSIVCSK